MAKDSAHDAALERRPPARPFRTGRHKCRIGDRRSARRAKP